MIAIDVHPAGQSQTHVHTSRRSKYKATFPLVRPRFESDPTIWGTHPMRPVRRTGDGFPPHKFYHGHPLPPNNSSNGQCNTPINFLGTLNRRKVLSFTVNCNSGLCYVFGTFELVTTLPTVQSLIEQAGLISACRASMSCCPPTTIPAWSLVTVHSPHHVIQSNIYKTCCEQRWVTHATRIPKNSICLELSC